MDSSSTSSDEYDYLRPDPFPGGMWAYDFIQVSGREMKCSDTSVGSNSSTVVNADHDLPPTHQHRSEDIQTIKISNSGGISPTCISLNNDRAIGDSLEDNINSVVENHELELAKETTKKEIECQTVVTGDVICLALFDENNDKILYPSREFEGPTLPEITTLYDIVNDINFRHDMPLDYSSDHRPVEYNTESIQNMQHYYTKEDLPDPPICLEEDFMESSNDVSLSDIQFPSYCYYDSSVKVPIDEYKEAKECAVSTSNSILLRFVQAATLSENSVVQMCVLMISAYRLIQIFDKLRHRKKRKIMKFRTFF